jgi:hypothetical protein
MLIFALALWLGSCNNISKALKAQKAVSIVQEAVMAPRYNTTTVGDALANYSYFNRFGNTWKEFQSADGTTTVEFTGKYKGTDFTVCIQFLVYDKEDEDGSSFRVGFTGYNRDGREWKNFGINGSIIMMLIYADRELPLYGE